MNDTKSFYSKPVTPYTPTQEDIVLLDKLHRIIENGSDVEVKRAKGGGIKILEVRRHTA